MYKIILTILLSLIISSCKSNKLHVYKNHKLYEKQLKKSLTENKLSDAKYILEHEPNIETLDYYKYLVKYYYMIDGLNELSKITSKKKNNFIKNYIKALIYTAKGVYYFDESLTTFYEALKYKDLYKESLSELYYNISVIEIKKENYENSMKYIKMAEINEEREKYIVLKAYILMKRGDYKETQKLLNESFNKIQNSKNLNKALNIMNFTFDAGKPMPKKLKEAYAKWLTVIQSGKNLQTVLVVAKEGMYEYPDYSEMYTLAGLASYLLDNKSQAVNYFDKAILINSEIPFNYIQMGIIYWNLKQYFKAEGFFKKAIELNRYLPIVYSYLSQLETQSGNIDRAIEYQEFQLKFLRSLEGEMSLVKLYEQVKDALDTKELLEKIIKKYPDDKRPYKEMVALYDKIIEEEPNHDIKLLLRNKQLMYEKLYEEKDEEESKRRLVNAEIESSDRPE